MIAIHVEPRYFHYVKKKAKEMGILIKARPSKGVIYVSQLLSEFLREIDILKNHGARIRISKQATLFGE